MNPRHHIQRVQAPAKLNIRLKVTGRRADGYHDLVSIMVPITLCDTLELTLTRSKIAISSEGFPVPDDETNLVHRSALAFFKRTGLPHGVSVKLVKKIPVSAGLGGGSSDAASTLTALNNMFRRPLSSSNLVEVALQLGADVPFFLQGGPCIARGIGEILEPIEKFPKFWYVIVTPHLAVSTSWVYRNLKLTLTSDDYDYIVTLLKKGRFELAEILENDLETVTAHKFPIVDNIKKSLLRAGAEGALMTGSGPSVFGVFRSDLEAAKARDHLASQNLGDLFLATQCE